MSTQSSTIDAITKSLDEFGDVSAKKMFGEYGLFLEGKMVAMVCDDRLFVKPTSAGFEMLPDAEEASPYPGSKPHIVIPPSRWVDGEWLYQLLESTADALPAPKKK